ncbi:hypothetical protein D6D01_00953 [Aureobasidium pullulans]|uniref:Uncharacterized protein n=1 Tax=Aureobasidium pullulans TaxID=5580 RepID=A0A4S9M0E4_AURPU|nr:hypothetical protein D6D01_00953 [Aureobasidium pullulans]
MLCSRLNSAFTTENQPSQHLTEVFQEGTPQQPSSGDNDICAIFARATLPSCQTLISITITTHQDECALVTLIDFHLTIIDKPTLYTTTDQLNTSRSLSMCNTVTIHYSCHHFAQFHRSTCRSIFWVTKRVGKIRKHSKAKKSHNKDKTSKDSPSKDDLIEDNDHQHEETRGRSRERTSSRSNSSRSPSSETSKPHSPSTHSPPPPTKLVSKAACKSHSDVVFRSPCRCGPCNRDSTRRIFDLGRKHSRPDLEYPSHKKRKHLRRHAKVSGGSPLKHELSIEELLRDDEEQKEDESTSLIKSGTRTVDGITKLLRLEPEKFWRCWRRFGDNMGRRHAG